MSIYSLSPQDFQLQNGTLMNTVQGFSFVMFVTQNCKFCHQFLPEFKQLPNNAPGVTFAVCSVDGNGREIFEMAKKSSSPIKAAPTFIFYTNGLPFAEYRGPRTSQDILQFIQGAIQESQNKMQQPAQVQQPIRTRQNDQTQREMPDIQPIQRHNLSQPRNLQMPSSTPQPSQPQQKWTVSATTGVKEFETSYGRPYNMANDQEFLEYERAYLESK